MTPDMSIIIVTYREDLAVLRACFASIRASQGITWKVFLVDNGARESTRVLLAELLPEAVYIANTENRGFAAGVNAGLRRAESSLILLLNPDTILPRETLHIMHNHMHADVDVGIASCVIRYPDGRLQESIRRFPRLIDQILILLKLPHILPRLRAVDRYMMRDVNLEKTQDVDSIMGAFMIIRRKLMDTIGLFDERYFMWFEEVDYCKRAIDAGWHVRSYSDATVFHHKGHMFHQLPTLQKQRWIRQSMRKYFFKHHGLAAGGVLFLLAPVFILLGYLAAFMKRG